MYTADRIGKRHILVLFMMLVMSVCVEAQDWLKFHTTYYGNTWAFPYFMQHFSNFDFSDEGDSLYSHYYDENGDEGDGMYIPFSFNELDSISFFTSNSDYSENQYKVFTMNINTRGGVTIDSKEEYVDCYLSINGQGEYPDYSGTGRIRGRGNSTWLWYDKKPYRIKLDTKSKILGLKKNKTWVLLANYRDPTDLMNTFAFETADWLGMPYTNHTRYLEVFLNGDYIGVYQLTEQVEQGSNRVNVSDVGGILLGIDLDDGPDLSPEATDNFSSEIYGLPICVKYPDEPTESQLDSIKLDLAVLEQAIKNLDYESVDSLLDINSFISMLQLQEFLYNVDFTAPRSVYMFKDTGGKYTMGPVWDWDAGYDFDWTDMYTGHDFFASYNKLMMGTSPYYQNGTYKMPKFFTDLFGVSDFVKLYKEKWNAVSDEIYSHNWETVMKYVENLNQGAYKRDSSRWEIGKSVQVEIERMRSWLSNRSEFLTEAINDYPEDDINPNAEIQVVGTISVEKNLDYNSGFTQNGTINISASEIAKLVGITEQELADMSNITIVPLFSDGTTVGENNTNGVFGGWFDGYGDPQTYSTGHVYIEVFDDLYNWSYGLRNRYNGGECRTGDSHLVRMQYRIPSGSVTKAVTIEVKMNIE